MASVKFSKGSDEWMMFQDYWKLCQEFWEPEETEEYLEGITAAAQDFYKKYKTPFAKRAACALLESIEDRCRGGNHDKTI